MLGTDIKENLGKDGLSKIILNHLDGGIKRCSLRHAAIFYLIKYRVLDFV